MKSALCTYCCKSFSWNYSRARKYCTNTCALNHSYSTGKRDRYKTVAKAQKTSQHLMETNNWLNSSEARDKLREIQKTKEYREKQRISKTGERNGMWNKRPWNKGEVAKIYWAEKEFKLLRDQCLIRDKGCCVRCGVSSMEKQLSCDHIIPFTVCREHKLENLQMLCISCHGKKTMDDLTKAKKREVFLTP